ncbi:MAG: hypothetical protein M1834_008204 [Cirrosporium novae-zelandiae]|nr:MAG: hypothetical protein M1834_008204 [Cirrosporium novae-zelandiae]
MGRKRKAGAPFGQPKSNEDGNESSKLVINSYEDVADSEDEFHLNRDKILLDEGRETKRRRKIEEEEAFLQPSDEEVLGYDSDDASEQSDEDEIDDEEDSDIESDIPEEYAPLQHLLKKGRRGSFAEESASAQRKDEYDEEAGWGDSKQDYYNADNIETEADALEEEIEAKRLQKKRLQKMTEADFGFDEDAWLDDEKAEEDTGNAKSRVVTEKLPQVQITPEMGEDEKFKLLRLRYPEFEPLAKEFVALQPLCQDLSLAATAAEAVIKHQSLKPSKTIPKGIGSKTPVAVVKYRALSAYLGVLSMYLAIFTSRAKEEITNEITAIPASELREHSVMASLLKWRGIWDKVKDLQIPDLSELVVTEEATSIGVQDAPKNKKKAKATAGKAPSKKEEQKRNAALQAEVAQVEAEARRAKRMRKTEENLADLSTLLEKKKTSKKLKAKVPIISQLHDDESDFGEETTLDPHEAEQKAKKKKSLRFYTSQITQKANKRDAAGRDAGGDADIPYRERLRDRQSRLNDEAERRGQKGRDLCDELGGESDEEDRRVAKAIRDEINGSEDNYYDMITARSQKKKLEKQSRAQAYEEAQNQGGQPFVQDTVGPDGKRKITYAIEKNKGLAPKRKKEVRNPRVKKRKKYEEKKKKLSSVRAVYKGGEGKGYGGELTGIKTGLVKSIKFN